MRSRGIAVHVLATPPSSGPEAVRREMESLGLNEMDLVAGIPWYVEVALEVMGITVRDPPDYPECVSHLLRRKVWRSTLGEVETDLASRKYPRIFVKPAQGAKGFSGTVLQGPRDGTLSGEFGFLNTAIFPSAGRDAQVFCSEVVDMNGGFQMD